MWALCSVSREIRKAKQKLSLHYKLTNRQEQKSILRIKNSFIEKKIFVQKAKILQVMSKNGQKFKQKWGGMVRFPSLTPPSRSLAFSPSPSLSYLSWATSSSVGWFAYSSSLKPGRRIGSKLSASLGARLVGLCRSKQDDLKGSQVLSDKQANLFEKY